jgi:ATP-dependent DNA helicase RecG
MHDFLSAPLTSLRNVGPAISKYLISLLGQDKVFGLLLHKPTRIEKILRCPRLFEVPDDTLVIIKATVESHIKPAVARQPFKVVCYSPTGYINLVFFAIFPSQLAKMKIGQEIAILGHLERSFIGKKMEFQIVHPQEIVPANEIEKLPQINVIYPLTAGVTQKFLTQKIREILQKLDEKNEEWIDEKLLQSKDWRGFTPSLKKLHYFTLPQNTENENYDESRNKACKRLAYDELLAWQIAMNMAKKQATQQKEFQPAQENLVEKFLTELPFQATGAQLKAISEITAEIASTKKMLRLLQGDVGSGKTVVAMASCLQAISQQKQTCVIAPTTVLAKQHLAYFRKFLEKENLEIEILTSANTKKQKDKILENLAAGKIHVLISTHAVLEDDIKFKNLGFVVIDEQHRFGVMQRLKLVEKGKDVDVLLMSATPIPRSLMMGLYGDMDISILNEKPKDRQKIETLIMSAKKIHDVHEAIKRAVSQGEKIYWVCPAIDETEEMQLVSAKEKFNELTKIFGEKNVGLLHGKMKEKEKEKIMAEFSDSCGSLKILVATTVIEVGIDVPDATVMLIENAENFGLSQLHQLRGRVGRSDKKSFCILLYGEKFGVNGRTRLNILRDSNDGFYIAEEDLKMRGSGDLLGTKQSGFPEFKIADLSFDSDILALANKNAKLILAQDEKLKTPQSHKYQELLKLFNYDDCLKMVSGG